MKSTSSNILFHIFIHHGCTEFQQRLSYLEPQASWSHIALKVSLADQKSLNCKPHGKVCQGVPCMAIDKEIVKVTSPNHAELGFGDKSHIS